ncbi:MAG: hypothetical protein PVG82_02820 [Chromatiales bacterium]|jgi:V/A-type H+-transporting ATPase subunit I
MSIRPQQARWFETFVARDQTVYALEALAGTGAVQLELDPRLTAPMDLRRVRQKLRQFEALASPYREQLASCEFCPTGFEGSPERIATQALHRLRVWTARVDHLRDQQQDLEQDRANLSLLQEALLALGEDCAALEPVGHHTDFLFKGLFACPPGQRLQPRPDIAVWDVYPGVSHDFLIVAALPEQAELARGVVEERVCESLAIPWWLGSDPGAARQNVQGHLDELDHASAEVAGRLEAMRRDQDMVEAVANMSTLRWYLDNAPSLASQQRLCHVSGWTTAPEPGRLQEALNRAQIKAVVRFPEPPSGAHAPVDTHQSWWSRPFEVFVRMWGTPGRAEVDPTGLLPLVVPLLFGYMFPDVGQGLVLMILAGLGSRRWPALRFLVPCGLASVLFGFLFGELFGLHGVLEPLWLRPLDDPLRVLLIPLGFGAMLLLMGLVFTGIEAHWRGELGRWLLADAAVLTFYVGVPLTAVHPPALPLPVVALIWYLIGSLLLARRGHLADFGASLGRLLHSVFDLALNTLSFVRVGAFALAHAGLSSAVVTLAERIDNPVGFALVLVVGNVVAMALEGLVVFVQTTRLVLFEFFVRFLHADGRLFRPLDRPGRDPRSH